MKKHLKIWAAAGMMALFMGTAAAAPQVILPKASIIASAADTIKDYNVGDFIYTVNETKGTATLKSVIASKKGSLASATVPATITYKTGKTAKVTEIGSSAFSCEYKLQTANLANASNLTKIGENAFHNCPLLTSITIPSNVTTIVEFAFEMCSGLKTVTFKTTKIKAIERNTFSGCKSLTSVNIPSSVTEIARSAFEDCEALTSITIPASVKKMGFSTFRNCKALTKVTFASTTAAITFDGSNFASCTALKNVVCGTGTSFALPSGVTAIPDYMFQNCKALTTVNISSKVSSIGSLAFQNCNSLTAINVNTSNTAYASESGVLYTKDHKTLMQYPIAKAVSSFKAHANTKQITRYAFQKNSALKMVDFSETSGLTIGNDNFGTGTPNIESLSIPASENKASNGANVLKNYKTLFCGTKLNTLNGSVLVKNVGNTSVAPAFHSTIATAMYDVFESYDDTLMMDKFLDAYAKFAVKDAYNRFGKTINSSADINNLSTLEKAYAIFKWVGDGRKYDGDDTDNEKNHRDASIFLHRKKDSADNQYYFYSVCDGFARAYNLIMKEAGLTCYYVHSGMYTNYYTDDNGKERSKLTSHAFNCVKIGSHYYIVDPTNNIFGVLTQPFMNAFGDFSTPDKWVIKSNKDEAKYKRHPAPSTTINLKNEFKYQICDINHDTHANNQDHALLQFYLVKQISLTTAQRQMADVNGDGVIDYRDAIAVRWYIETFREGSKTYYRMGDLNSDKQVNNSDWNLLYRYVYQGGAFNLMQTELADLNNDGDITAADLTKLNNLAKYKFGDVNRDGKVNATDKDLLQKHITKTATLSNAVLWYADVNGDGSIDIADVVKMCADYNIK